MLTSLDICSYRPEEVDNVRVRSQVGHYLQLGHQGLQNVFAGERVGSLDSDRGLVLVILYTWQSEW